MNPKDQPKYQDPTLIGNEKPRQDNEDPSWRPTDTDRKPGPDPSESQDKATHGPEDRRGEDRNTL